MDREPELDLDPDQGVVLFGREVGAFQRPQEPLSLERLVPDREQRCGLVDLSAELLSERVELDFSRRQVEHDSAGRLQPLGEGRQRSIEVVSAEAELAEFEEELGRWFALREPEQVGDPTVEAGAIVATHEARVQRNAAAPKGGLRRSCP